MFEVGTNVGVLEDVYARAFLARLYRCLAVAGSDGAEVNSVSELIGEWEKGVFTAYFPSDALVYAMPTPAWFIEYSHYVVLKRRKYGYRLKNVFDCWYVEQSVGNCRWSTWYSKSNMPGFEVSAISPQDAEVSSAVQYRTDVPKHARLKPIYMMLDAVVI